MWGRKSQIWAAYNGLLVKNIALEVFGNYLAEVAQWFPIMQLSLDENFLNCMGNFKIKWIAFYSIEE